MLPGIALVFFFDPAFADRFSLLKIVLGVVSACLVASSNYVLNEILDAPFDRFHPVKRHRPIPRGELSIRAAYAEWLVLAAVGFAIGAWIGPRFLASIASLLVADPRHDHEEHGQQEREVAPDPHQGSRGLLIRERVGSPVADRRRVMGVQDV